MDALKTTCLCADCEAVFAYGEAVVRQQLECPKCGSTNIGPPGRPNADLIHMILIEDARVENGQLANAPYLAVRIAEALESALAPSLQ